MSTSDRQARDRDRDAAIELVGAAWADGQIVEADRDKRVEELRRAQTLAEIDLLTRGLQGAPTYRTEPVDVEPEEPVLETPPSAVPYGPAPTSVAEVSVAAGAPARTGRLPKVVLLIPLVAVLLVAACTVVAVLAVGGDDDVAADGADQPGEVLTAQGYDELLDAVEDERGTTEVFDAVLYPAYAVVSLPVDATTLREESWYWDGTDLRSNDSKSTSSSERFDLARVDGSVVVGLVDRVRLLVEEPTSWYAIVRAPDHEDSMIWAYASNEYDETAYLGARRDGTVVYDSTEQ